MIECLPFHSLGYFKVSELKGWLKDLGAAFGDGEGGGAKIGWEWVHNARVEQLSRFGWQMRIETDPKAAVNWLMESILVRADLALIW